MIVIDCSALLALLLGADAEDLQLDKISQAGDVAAPDFIHVEMASALRRLEMSRQITARQASDAISDFMALPLQSFGAANFLAIIWQLRNNFSAYDAAYVALAQILGVPLLTRDQKLRRAVVAHTAVVLA